ncbi:hypothetical protein RB597_001333 [Gaeumannomyces tritici]
MKTEVVRVDPAAAASLGRFREVVAASSNGTGSSSSNISITPIQNLASWELAAAPSSGPSGDAHVDADEHPALGPLRRAAERLRSSDVPVAFPTETVYGLGADATRSAAVRGIYAAKGRPSDNPLIVHVCDLDMLRSLLVGATPNDDSNSYDDPIPPIYLPLLQRFWPGPLTILLRNPTPPPPASRRLAPEVTAGLPTFGARLPASPLALALIRLAGAPLAAPSANASTRPSPTAARHVLDDLDGRLEMILDGGPCGVGVESTVVDGLSDPPAVLRPGGVGIEEIRACPGWEGVVRAYRDEVQVGAAAAPRAPGMKYKHYSPRARVVLYEGGFGADDGAWEAGGGAGRRIGIVRTRSSAAAAGSLGSGSGTVTACGEDGGCALRFTERERRDADGGATTVLETSLGRDPRHVAQGLFSALRELDARRADVIFVEGVGDGDDIAAAVMNRLRKAASEVR